METRVSELIAEQLGQFSSNFAASMQASFDNIRPFIDDRFSIVKFTQFCSKIPLTALLNFACDG